MFILFIIVGVLAVILSKDVTYVEVQYAGEEGDLDSLSWGQVPWRLSLFPGNADLVYAGDLSTMEAHEHCGRASSLGLTLAGEDITDAQTTFYLGQTFADSGRSFFADPVICEYNLTLKHAMSAPIMVMYRLNHFHQNYQMYIDDYDEEEMHGEHNSIDRDRFPDCRYHVFTSAVREDINRVDENGVSLINDTVQVPCGLVANSFFTDQYKVLLTDGNETSTPFINTSNLVWESDKHKFRNSAAYPLDATPYWDDYPYAKNIQYLYERYNFSISRSEGVYNDQFISWIRSEFLSDFRKPYGVIHEDLAANTKITIRIVSSFNTMAFGGAKALVLTTYGTIGGDVSMFGIVSICFGVLAFIGAMCTWFRNTVSHRHVKPGRTKIAPLKNATVSSHAIHDTSQAVRTTASSGKQVVQKRDRMIISLEKKMDENHQKGKKKNESKQSLKRNHHHHHHHHHHRNRDNKGNKRTGKSQEDVKPARQNAKSDLLIVPQPKVHASRMLKV
jgi:hypothetical protein